MMLSVMLMMPSESEPEPAHEAAQSLAALVPFAVDGLVRDVMIVSAQPSSLMRDLAEECGALLVADLDAGLRQARCPRLLIVAAGALVTQDVMRDLWQRGALQADAAPLRLSAVPIRWYQTLRRPIMGLVVSSRALGSSFEQAAPMRVITLASLLRRFGAAKRCKTPLQRAPSLI